MCKIELTKNEVEDTIQRIFDKDNSPATVVGSRLPKKDDEYCVTADLYGYITQKEIEEISEAFGDDNLMIGVFGDKLQITFIPEKHPETN